jgi:hypothetical protein
MRLSADGLSFFLSASGHLLRFLVRALSGLLCLEPRRLELRFAVSLKLLGCDERIGDGVFPGEMKI